ncbi:MAG: rhodanese-like domain-containing protein [Bacteroidota bacterium]
MRILPILLLLTSLGACQSSSSQNESSSNSTADTEQTSTPEKGSMTVAQLPAFLEANPETIILDVRTPEEIAEGKIEGAIELDYRSPDFQQKLQELDRDQTYVVYCMSGGRSGRTCKMMEVAGFSSYYNLEGGMNAYQQQ